MPSPSARGRAGLSGEIGQFVNDLLNVIEQVGESVRVALSIVPDGSYKFFLLFCQFDFFLFVFSL